MSDNTEEQNQYPISREDQIRLWHECAEDACKISQDIHWMFLITQVFFSYRVGVLSDRILDHDMMEVDDDELAELLERDKE